MRRLKKTMTLISQIKIFAKKLAENTIIIGLVSLFWLLYRSGTKPSRIAYPCQKAAAANCYSFLFYPLLTFLAGISRKTVPNAYYAFKDSEKRHTIALAALLVLSTVTSGLAAYSNILINPWNAFAGRTTLVENLAEVSVVKVKGNDVEAALRDAVNDLGGIESIVPEGAKVMIKPNIVRPQAPPDTIDPTIVRALINILKERNPTVIWVGDGSGEQNTLQNMISLGYAPIANIPGVELVDLNYGELVTVPVPGGGYIFDSFQFNRKVAEADVFISLACMKTHYTAVVTLGMKNLIGIAAGSVYGIPKMKLHERAQEKGDDYMGGVIVDLCSTRKIDLTIIDGRIAMEGEGPHAGDPVNMGLIIVGKDPVATDAVTSAIMGFDPEKVPSIKLGQQKGLGTNDLHRIKVKGETIQNVFYPFLPAEGHESFHVMSRTQLLLYRWRTFLIFPAATFIGITAWLGLAPKHSKDERKTAPIQGWPNYQTSLETFQPAPEPEEEKMVSVPDFSVKHLEKDIDSYLTEFQRYSKQIDETSVRLEELSKLLKSGEISQNTYDSIADDLGRQLFSNVEEAFKIREGLEFVKAKALLECAKEKAKATEGAESTKERSDLQYVKDYRDLVESEYWTETISRQAIYSLNLQKWEGLVQKIDEALSSLSIEKEAAIIEQYLSLLKERLASGITSDQTRRAITLCQQRLSSISDAWSSIRRSKIEEIMNLETEASKIRDQIKEFEARYSVGELTQSMFERENSELQINLKKVEQEISSIRRYIDDMDMKIFKASELLEENK